MDFGQCIARDGRSVSDDARAGNEHRLDPRAKALLGTVPYRNPRNDKIARTTTIAPMSQMMLFMMMLS